MVTTARALGRLFNLVPISVPVEAVAGAITGNRVRLRGAGGITFAVLQATDAGTTDDLAVDLQEHNAASGGTSQDLDIVTDYYHQFETALDGDETFTKVTQTAASEITAIAGTAETENMLVIEVGEDQLSDNFDWISLNVPDLGSTDVQWTSILGILWDLQVQRAPENLGSQQ